MKNNEIDPKSVVGANETGTEASSPQDPHDNADELPPEEGEPAAGLTPEEAEEARHGVSSFIT